MDNQPSQPLHHFIFTTILSDSLCLGYCNKHQLCQILPHFGQDVGKRGERQRQREYMHMHIYKSFPSILSSQQLFSPFWYLDYPVILFINSIQMLTNVRFIVFHVYSLFHFNIFSHLFNSPFSLCCLLIFPSPYAIFSLPPPHPECTRNTSREELL